MNEVKVKICGITRKEDALNAAKFGADFIGFNFFEESPRFISVQKAIEIKKNLSVRVKTVGVFVNERAEKINTIAKECALDFVQLHGNETKEFCKKIEKPIIKAFRVQGIETFKQIESFNSQFVLLDAFSSARFGGTGKTIEKKFLPHIKEVAAKRKLFLSGGLTAENVHETIVLVQPFCVDVASGVEIAPGIKSAEKMKKFISEAKK